MHKATISYLKNPYNNEFNWQVDFGHIAKQWFKDKEKAEKAADSWNSFLTTEKENV